MNKDQLESLKSLLKHPGWAVVEELEERERARLSEKLWTANLDDPQELAIVRSNQIYIKARKDFILNVKANTGEIYTPDI